MPGDELKLKCIFCGHHQTVRLRAGDWWTCKKCAKRNPGTSAVRDIFLPLIEAGRYVVGRRHKKVARAADDDRRAKAGSSSSSTSPTAGTTIGRRAAKPATKATTPKVETPKPPPAKAPAEPSETSRPLGRRLLQLGKELLV